MKTKTNHLTVNNSLKNMQVEFGNEDLFRRDRRRRRKNRAPGENAVRLRFI